MVKLFPCGWLKKPALFVMCLPLCAQTNAQQLLWKSAAYSIYADRVVQDKFSAVALSRSEIVSGYKSPANEFKTSIVSFKFSINGKDNEMISGTDHHFNLNANSQYSETPLIHFGRQLKLKKDDKAGFLKAGTQWKVKLDMRGVFKDFTEKGYYTTFDGGRIYKDDFKGVYVAGSSSPLMWDFDNLVNFPNLKMEDADGDGIYEILLEMNATDDGKATESGWKQSFNLSPYPRYISDHVLADALYNLSMEEMVKAVEPDSTLRTGKEWAGVWTRDVSYSIILSMAHLQPAAAKYSLLRKVDSRKKIIQDTGTGGAWPVSTDRMIWAVAAWELYKVTGDKQWLAEAYEVIRNSIYADMKVVYDKATGLVKGESSFLDWREQTYPLWMQPADIFESFNLGTNAVHYKANAVAAEMATLLGDQAGHLVFEQNATGIRKAINEKLWLPAQKGYAQYLYGRACKIVSPRTEALGSALCVIFGIADEQQAKDIVSSMPLTPYGVSCIYPQIPGIPPYHNNGIWPFVQSYWMWAGALAKNDNSVMESIAAIYRPAALFTTNKENFVAENGDYAGTQINSSNMLWSLSGNISIVHRILFGIHFDKDQLLFRPFVPESMTGSRRLENFRYRQAVLDIMVEGYGDEIDEFLLDGKPVSHFAFSAHLTGKHTIQIKMRNSGNRDAVDKLNHQPVVFTPATPDMKLTNGVLTWKAVPGAAKYCLIINGAKGVETKSLRYVPEGTKAKEYQLIAMDINGNESFASEPVYVAGAGAYQHYEMEKYVSAAAYPYKGYSADGFVETSTTVHTRIVIPISVASDGTYLLDTRYANGNGPVNTDNKCAVRTVLVNGVAAGNFVFPHRGKEEWSEWGWTNQLKLALTAGKHEIVIEYQPANENMNILTNQAMLDQLRIRKLN